MRLNFLLASVITLYGCSETPGQTEENFPEASLDSLLEGRYSDGRFTGSLVIEREDGHYYSRSYGLAHRGWGIPVDSRTRFDIASVNKSFIAALVLLAAEENRLSLEDRLVDHLAEYSYSGNFDPAITLKDMLRHSSGLPDYDAIPDSLAADQYRRFKRMHFTDPDYVDFISRLPPAGSPGQQFHYSNFAYHLLAIILEDAYDMEFNALLSDQICQPLGLTHTFNPGSNQLVYDSVAEGYSYREEDDSWVRNDFIDLSLGRRIFSTAADLAKWGRAMTDDRLLSDQSRERMLTNEYEPPVSYGLGWVIFDRKGEYTMGNLGYDGKYIIHGGSTEGYRSMVCVIENGEYVISFLANSGDRTEELELTGEIVKILYP